ncbi:hypothetical protein LMG32879_002180 [Brytella acorum]|uniref:DUF433 domain-containing protein n=2 Tax=Brytella acorum TaxID=2959299 RepID=A0AA35Y4Q1_9PROT|nr:hypothetical protein LMG32879_002180 [Brytella acorum]
MTSGRVVLDEMLIAAQPRLAWRKPLAHISKIVGQGVYPVPMAARLLRVSPSKVRAWVYGNGGEAVLTPELDAESGKDALSFVNLIEVMFLADLRGHGVSLQSIRAMLARTKRTLDLDHPFATRKFHTDGKAIWLETADETGDRAIIDLTDGNGAMLEVLERSFRKSVSFDLASGQANVWRPSADQPRVVLDPARQFGRPIDGVTGVPTEVLADALKAERGDVARVAAIWEVEPEAVEQAAEFELQFSRRLAA